ncbi:MAG: FG-GAP-like repeat-containing protein [bacterium]|nr:FG-GAP-like repeat-containing protein [bacterium]
MKMISNIPIKLQLALIFFVLVLPVFAFPLYSVGFEEVNIAVAPAYNGNIVWGDYDADGDLDLAISGYIVAANMSKIYRNDQGSFVDINAVLPAVNYCSLAWGDYDNDGDLDLVLAGNTTFGYFSSLTRIYRNDAGSFVDSGIPLVGVAYGCVAWGDYNGDGWLDLVVTGSNENGATNVIYQNTGSGFIVKTNLLPVRNSSAAWGDYDNDGDLDLAVMGSCHGVPTNIIYKNNNNGFIKRTNLISVLAPVNLAWGDYNADGFFDLITAGYNDPRGTNIIYLNQAGNSFVKAATLPGINSACAAWGDYDNDGDLDLVLHGSLSTRIYENRGGNVFTDINAGLTGSTAGHAAWGDYDNDGYLDLVTIGYASGVQIKLYRNTGCIFSKTAVSLPGLQNSSAAWGDYDYDGDLDLVLAGQPGSTAERKTNIIYQNNNGTLVYRTNLQGIYSGSVSWGDYDNDNDLDLLVTGTTNSLKGICVLYSNHNGSFVLKVRFAGVFASRAAWGDYDNDGDLDFILMGGVRMGESTNLIFRNNAGVFTRLTNFSGLQDGTVSWVDYDNDGDLDIAFSGYTNGGLRAYILRNDQGRFFNINANLYAMSPCEMAWGDYDSDGDPDLVFIGDHFSDNHAYLYNNYGGNFIDSGIGLRKFRQCSAKWYDYDNDGDLDLGIAGSDSGNKRTNMIYRNNKGVLEPVSTGLLNVSDCVIAPGDYDNDGDLDLLVSGCSNGSEYRTYLYSNELGKNHFTLPNDPAYIRSIKLLSVLGKQYTFQLTLMDNEAYNGRNTPVLNDSTVEKVNIDFYYSLNGNSPWKKYTTYENVSCNSNLYNVAWTAEDGNNIMLRFILRPAFGKAGKTAAGPFLYPAKAYTVSLNQFRNNVSGSPSVRISAPSANERVSGIVPVLGYAYDNDLSGFKLVYGGTASGTIIQASGNRPPFQKLADWDTSSLASGTYSLTLTAWDIRGFTNTYSVNNLFLDKAESGAPSVTAVYPLPGQEDAALNTPIAVKFSTYMNPDTLLKDTIKVLDDSGTAIPGDITYNSYAQTLTFNPDGYLESHRYYTVIVSELFKAVNGLSMPGDYIWQFRTAVDLSASISSVSPAWGSRDIKISTNVTALFSLPPMSNNFNNYFTLKDISGNVVSGTCSYNTGLSRFTYAPTAALQPTTYYIASFNKTILGSYGDYTWYFVTEDILQPAVLWASPADDETFVDPSSTIRIKFNKRMNQDMLNADYIYLSDSRGRKTECEITYSVYNNEVLLKPAAALQENALYQVSVSGLIQDFGGRTLGASSQWSFKTAQTISRMGGRVQTPDNNVGLMIPPYALSGDIVVRINKLSGTDIPLLSAPNLTLLNSQVYQLSPNALVLKKSVTVTLKYSDADTALLDESRFSLYSCKDGLWTRIGGSLNMVQNEIYGVIKEFNIIALVEDKNTYSGDLDKIVLDCQPRVFNPREWGTASLSFSLPKPVKYSIRVYNMAGKLVDVVTEDAQGQAGQNIVFWDGKNLKAKTVPNSMYLIAIEINDGSKSLKKTKTIVILDK